jgi:hypothetical protein
MATQTETLSEQLQKLGQKIIAQTSIATEGSEPQNPLAILIAGKQISPTWNEALIELGATGSTIICTVDFPAITALAQFGNIDLLIFTWDLDNYRARAEELNLSAHPSTNVEIWDSTNHSTASLRDEIKFWLPAKFRSRPS